MNVVQQTYSGTLVETADIVVREAVQSDAAPLAEMWDAALGTSGIWQEGCEPYPDPSLFSIEDMNANIDDPARQIILAEDGKRILGAMIIDWLSPYHCEHNCMSVRRDEYGRGIGSLLVQGATTLLSSRGLVINCTELVTHSMASQSAHINQGYDAICGFGYAHYPRVFSPFHRESVLWAWRLFCNPEQNSVPSSAVAIQLISAREIHIAKKYSSLVKSIIQQIEPCIKYKLSAGSSSAEPCRISIDPKEGQRHCYIDVLHCGSRDSFSAQLLEALTTARSTGKTFVLVRINANDPGCPEITEWLSSEHFCFHSFLPVYRYSPHSNELSDLFCMQWIAPEEVALNPLPGNSASFIQLYGYPLQVTGKIIETIRREVTV